MSTQLTQIDNFKSVLATAHMKTLNNFFENNEEKTKKFLSAVSYCVQSTPSLLRCDQNSLINAFMKCAEYNLFPSSVSGEAYILPYGNQAQFQLGYKGIITLLKRQGINIYTDIVKEQDEFELTSGFDQNIIHKYPRKSRGNPEGVYALAIVDGDKYIKYMSSDEVLKFKKFSKSANSATSPWNENNDPELNMWRKTAIKQLAKNLSLTENISKAIADDNADGDIKDYQERQAIEHATRPSEGKIGNLLGIIPTKKATETTQIEEKETKTIEVSETEIKPQETIEMAEKIQNLESGEIEKIMEENFWENMVITEPQIAMIVALVKKIHGDKPYMEQVKFIKNIISEKFKKIFDGFEIEEIVKNLDINEAAEIIAELKSKTE